MYLLLMSRVAVAKFGFSLMLALFGYGYSLMLALFRLASTTLVVNRYIGVWNFIIILILNLPII